jgi:hypothetical protein
MTLVNEIGWVPEQDQMCFNSDSERIDGLV